MDKIRWIYPDKSGWINPCQPWPSPIELLSYLFDFARMGDKEAEFLLQIQAITTCVEFYLKICGNTNASDTELEVSEDDNSDDNHPR